MPVDTSIYGAVAKGGDGGLFTQAYQNAQLVGQRNRLAELQFKAAERDQAKADAINKAYATPGVLRADGTFDTPLLTNTLAQLGQGSQIPSLLKSQAELTAAQTTAAKNKFDLNGAKEKRTIQILATAADANDLAQKIAEGVQRGDWTAEEAAPYVQGAPQDPTMFRQYTTGLLTRILSPQEQMAARTQKIEYQDTGGARVAVNTNPLAGPVGPVEGLQPLEKTVTPDSVLSAETSRANNAASVGATIRGQNMTDARSRENNAATRENTAALRAERAAEKAAAGTEKGVTAFSSALQKEGIPELETAVAGAEGALGRYPVGQVPGIGAVKNALPAALMSDEGKDVRQSLAQVRNIVLSARSGAAVTDQELRRLVEEIGTGAGMSEADIRKGLTKIRQRLDSIKSNAAAGVNDEVLAEYGARGGIPIQRGNAAKPQQLKGAARITSDADYNALPSGTVFIDPNGVQRRKP